MVFKDLFLNDTHYLLDTPIGPVGVWGFMMESPAFDEWYDSLMPEDESEQFRRQWHRIIRWADFLHFTTYYANKYINSGEDDDERERRAEYCIDAFKRHYNTKRNKGEADFLMEIYKVFPPAKHDYLEGD